MRFNILMGGKAGQGPNILSYTFGKALVRKGFFVFYSRDYQSLIRGGHNFNIMTFSNEPVHSNDSKIDILVALDEETINIHRNSLSKDSYIIKGEGTNMYLAGKLFKTFGLDFKLLEDELKEIGKRFEENKEEASKGYHSVGKIFELEEMIDVLRKKTRFFRNGNRGVSEGAINAGLDVYYAYPMTPATPLMGELAEKQTENNHIVIELENEIGVANAGVGSSITGAKTMVGTSGGGFDLMSETLSLTGMAEVPLVFFLSQRPGPATGVATYTAQGDLNLARHAGHGEFPRIVVAPGDPKECEELTTNAFYFAQKFQTPSIILSDKHLGESFYTYEGKPKLTSSGKWTSLRRYNSYERDIHGSSTENPKLVNKNVMSRRIKQRNINQEAQKFEQFKVYGNPSAENVIVSWGSTKGAIIDAIESEGLDVKFVQILYIDPFPKAKLWRELIGKNTILVENNATAQMNALLKEKIGFNVPAKNIILRYDARPFLRDKLTKEIKLRMRKKRQ